MTSGYPGEGPKGTSLIIRLAEEAGIIIKELKAAPSLFKRINTSLATKKDVKFIKKNSLESLNYDRLCLKIVDKEYVQRAKDFFKKNKDIIFVRKEDEKTKDAVEINLGKINKKLDMLIMKLDKIEINTNNSGLSSTLKEILTILSSIKTVFRS